MIIRWPFYVLMVVIAIIDIALVVRNHPRGRDRHIVVIYPAITLTAVYAIVMCARVVVAWATGVVEVGGGLPPSAVWATIGNGVLLGWMATSMLLLWEVRRG